MFRVLTQRNRQIFWHRNYWLISLLIFITCLTILLKLMNQSYSDVYKGVLQLGGPIYVPHIWLSLTLIPFLAIGQTVRQLIKEHYVHVHKVSLPMYISSILQIVSEITLLFWIIPFIILQPINNWDFALYHFDYLLLLVMIYSLATVFMKPIHVLEIFLVLLICCIVQNDFYLLSQLMTSRFELSYIDIAIHFGLLGFVLWCLIINVKNIDFLTN